MITRYWYPEERAAALLIALRRPLGLDLRDGRLLEHYLRHVAVVRRCSVERPTWRPGRDGRGRILLPRTLPYWRAMRAKFHEFAHPLLEVGGSSIVLEASEAERSQHRQAADIHTHEEWLADLMALALRVPAHLVTSAGCPEAISRYTGLPPATIARRIYWVEREPIELRRIPRWSAGAVWTILHQSGPAACLWVVDAEERPLFRVPVDRTNLRHRIFRLQADLLALRPQEVRLRYEAWKPLDSDQPARRLHTVPIDVGALRGWAGLPA